MIYIVIALSPGGGGILDSTHTSREAAEIEAERLNLLAAPFSYVAAERTYVPAERTS